MLQQSRQSRSGLGMLLTLALLLAAANVVQATIVWGSINGPVVTQAIMDACYDGQDPGPVEVDECGCLALGNPYEWDGQACIDTSNPGG